MSLLLSTVRPRKSAQRSASSTARRRSAAARASITSRATAPFWRASTKRPGTSIVRSTFGAAATSISVTIVVLGRGATVGATRPADPARSGARPWRRSPARGRRAAAGGGRCRRARASRSPSPLATSITRSVRSVTAKIRRPSVLMTSGSSTPASCVLVPEKSGTAPPTRRRPRRRPGAAVGTSAPRSSASVGRHRRRRDRVDRRPAPRGRSTPDAAVRAQRAGARVVDELLAGGEGLQPRPAWSPRRRCPPRPRARTRTTAASDSHPLNVLSMCPLRQLATGTSASSPCVMSPCVCVLAAARRAPCGTARRGSRCGRSRSWCAIP